MLHCKTSPSLIRSTRLPIRTAFSRWNCLGKQYHEFNIFSSKLIRFCAESFKYKINENARATFAWAFGGELLLFCATQTWDIMIFGNLQPKYWEGARWAGAESALLTKKLHFATRYEDEKEEDGIFVSENFPTKINGNISWLFFFLSSSTTLMQLLHERLFAMIIGSRTSKRNKLIHSGSRWVNFRSRHGANLFLISLLAVGFVCRSFSFVVRLPTDCTFSRQRVMFDAG